MRQSLKNVLVPLCFIGLCMMIGCNHHGNNRDGERTALLSKPPYAPLTDSLLQHKSANEAGLYFRRAELLTQNDQHELAASDYARSWNLQPDEMTGFRYASTLSIIGQTNSAVQILQDCRKKFPANTAFPGMLAELYQQTGEMKNAIGIYDAMLRTDSLDFEAWYEKGLLQEKNSDTPDAIQALRNAYAIQPLNTYGLELAHLYAETRNAAALPICDAILKKDSAHDLLDPFFIKGIYFSNTVQYKKAIVQFDSCINRDWKFTDAYLEKGIALFKQKQYQPALLSFQMTIKVSENYADGYFWIGRCYEATGLKQEAVLYYREALALDKEFTEAAEGIKRLQ